MAPPDGSRGRPGPLQTALNSPSPLVVLDLDHTLIHSEKINVKVGGLDLQSFLINVNGQDYRTFLRPGVSSFIQALDRRNVHYAVWTAGIRLYARKVVDGIRGLIGTFEPQFTWWRSENDTHVGVKDMSWVAFHYPKYSMSVLLDDSKHHLRQRNGVALVEIVPKFHASNPQDTHLQTLAELVLASPPLPLVRCPANTRQGGRGRRGGGGRRDGEGGGGGGRSTPTGPRGQCVRRTLLRSIGRPRGQCANWRSMSGK